MRKMLRGRALCGALVLLALMAPEAPAAISPTGATFSGGGSVTFGAAWGTVICSSTSLSGSTPAGEEATSVAIGAPALGGCSSPTLGPAIVTTRGTWTIGYSSAYASPGRTAASVSIPSEGLQFSFLSGTCVVRVAASTVGSSGTHEWVDGGSLHDQDQPPSSQLALSSAGSLSESGCFGLQTGTMTTTWALTNTESAVALWAGAPTYKVSPNPLRFSDTRRNQTLRRTVRLSNGGEGEVTITRIRVIGDAVFSAEAGFRVRPGASSPLEITFAPLARRDYAAKIVFEEGETTIWTLEVKGRGIE
jgi:hypothetical protein